MVFGQKLKILILAKQRITGKGMSRGAKWHDFQLHSTFIVRGFWPEKDLPKQHRYCTYLVPEHSTLKNGFNSFSRQTLTMAHANNYDISEH